MSGCDALLYLSRKDSPKAPSRSRSLSSSLPPLQTFSPAAPTPSIANTITLMNGWTMRSTSAVQPTHCARCVYLPVVKVLHALCPLENLRFFAGATHPGPHRAVQHVVYPQPAMLDWRESIKNFGSDCLLYPSATARHQASQSAGMGEKQCDWNPHCVVQRFLVAMRLWHRRWQAVSFDGMAQAFCDSRRRWTHPHPKIATHR